MVWSTSSSCVMEVPGKSVQRLKQGPRMAFGTMVAAWDILSWANKCMKYWAEQEGGIVGNNVDELFISGQLSSLEAGVGHSDNSEKVVYVDSAMATLSMFIWHARSWICGCQGWELLFTASFLERYQWGMIVAMLVDDEVLWKSTESRHWAGGK